MKNILLILNATITPPHVIDGAINIAKSTSALLHTVFLNYDSDLAEYNYPFLNDLSLTRNSLTGKTIAEENAALTESQARLFADECRSAKVDFFIEPRANVSQATIIELSTFADCILVDAHEDFREHHISDLLRHAHCPLYLLSKDAAGIQHVIFAYDGSPSSMYAIKMYSYLFPAFRDLKTYLVYVNADSKTALPNQEPVTRWLAAYYGNLEIKMLRGDVDETLAGFAESLPHALVVMGSYGRNNLSRLFHKSSAQNIIEHGKSSVFMTHQ